MQSLALDIVNDATVFVVDYLPIVLAVAFLIALMMWILALVSRYFEYLKMLESPWLDRDTLDFIHKVLQAIWVSFIAIATLILLQFRVPEIREGLIQFFKRVPTLFFVIFVIFVAAVLVRSLHRFASYLRGDLKVKPRRIAPPRTLSFTELFLKYLIYAIAGVVAFVGGIGALPPEDKQYKDVVFTHIAVPEPAVVLGFVVAIVAIFVASRFVDSVFEDMKRRGTKFTPRVIEELKSTAKYAVYAVGAVVMFILAVDLILSGEQLLVFTVAVILVVLVAALIGFDVLRNGLAGVTLMLANPFDVGDRIRIGDGPEGTVESTGLMMTQVRTVGGELINFSNTELLKKDVLNYSRSPTGVMVVNMSLPFSIGQQTVHAAMLEAAQKTHGVEQKPPPQVLSKDVRGSTIAYQLVTHTKDVLRTEEIKSELIANLQSIFTREDISPVVSES